MNKTLDPLAPLIDLLITPSIHSVSVDRGTPNYTVVQGVASNHLEAIRVTIYLNKLGDKVVTVSSYMDLVGIDMNEVYKYARLLG